MFSLERQIIALSLTSLSTLVCPATLQSCQTRCLHIMFYYAQGGRGQKHRSVAIANNVIKFYSHQLMHFFIQLCISLLSYIKIT